MSRGSLSKKTPNDSSKRYGGVLAVLPRELFQLRVTFGLKRDGFHERLRRERTGERRLRVRYYSRVRTS
jgi:hypothetical protein